MAGKNKYIDSIGVLEEIILKSGLDLPYILYHAKHHDSGKDNQLLAATADLHFSDLSSLEDIKFAAVSLKEKIKEQTSLSDEIISYYFKMIDKAAEDRLLNLYHDTPE